MLLQAHVTELIDGIFRNAHADGRGMLYEHEVYEMLKAVGLETPRYVFAHESREVDERLLSGFRGKVVIKVVSRDIAHKQKLGGVKIVDSSDPLFVRYVIASMRKEVLSHFDEASKPQIEGFMIIEFIPHKQALGYEILFGAREDAAFGPVLTLSKGGDDAEFFAKYYDPANLYIAPLTREEAVQSMMGIRIRHKYDETGHAQYTDMIAETLMKISDLAQTYSFISARKNGYRLKALDINPVVFAEDERFVVVDGFAQFEPAKGDMDKPLADAKGLEGFFKPKGIAVVGVSSDPQKYSLGRNIASLLAGMGREDIHMVNRKGGSTQIRGKEYPLFPSVKEIPDHVDLYVYAAPAQYTLDFMAEVEPGKCVILISGIPSDVKYTDFLRRLKAASKQGVRIVGPNCMGIFHAPDKDSEGVDTLFIDEERMPMNWGEKSNAALFTQSGAMAITCLDKLHYYGLFRAIASFGNRADVGIPELMAYFENEPSVAVMALYMEGLTEGEGRQLFEIAKTSKKPILVFKSGRTEAGARAAASHTAAMSGSYEVFKAACTQAGAVLIEEIDSFYDAIATFSLLWDKKVKGNRVAGVVNAGFDSTAGADTLEYMTQAVFTEETVKRLEALNTHGLANVPAPFLDVTPMTDDAQFEGFVRAMMEDPGVDCLAVAVVPHIENLMTTDDVCTDPDAIAMRLIRVFREYDKPMVVSVNAGKQFSKFVRVMQEAGLPVFTDIRAAILAMERMVRFRLEKR
jgi:3-hydroxypropionyl-CoA synthetase (ADP-forming)